ncbi:tyrosine-type recombinase/integrase [Streptomyces sp. NPDC020898]|uniref:tyrosine-type recombinase/integrase n=1 Tax=Streptomyces sp. NPDC020898 TaxID=3365101 RepID=UPI0037931697
MDSTQKTDELGTKCPGPGRTRRRPRKDGFATKKDAEEKAQEVWDLAQVGIDILSDATMSQHLRRRLDGKQRIKRSTRHSYEDCLRLYFIPQLGHIKLRDLRPIRLHDLRHGAATIALLAGVHIKVVQKKLGHSSIKVTGDICTSVLEEVEREAAEATLTAVPRARKNRKKQLGQPAEQAETEGTRGEEDEDGSAAA